MTVTHKWHVTNICSTVEFLQLEPPQRWEDQHRPGDTDPDTQVRAVGTNHSGNWPNEVDLVHADDCADPTDQEGRERRNADGQLRGIGPVVPVEASGLAEDQVLFEGDGQVDGDPVAHQGEPVLEDLIQIVPTGKGADGVNDDTDARPEPARQLGQVTAHHLEAERGRVGTRDIVGDETEGNQHAHKLAEPTEATVAGQNQGTGRGAIGCLPGGVAESARAETNAEEVGKGQCQADTQEGQQEGLPLRSGGREVDEEVSTGGGPRDGRRQGEGEESEAVASDGL